MNSGINKLIELKNKKRNGIWEYITNNKPDLLKKFRIAIKYLRKRIDQIEVNVVIGKYVLKNISINNDYILLYFQNFQTETKIGSVLMIINKTENEEDYMIVDCSSLKNVFEFIDNLYHFAGAK